MVTLLIAPPGLAVAQGAPPPQLPRGAEPDVRLEGLPPIGVPPPAPEVVVPERAPTRAPAGADRIRFVLRELTLDGVTAYPPGELESLYVDSIGEEIALTDIYRIAEAIQRRYRDDGYFLTRVLVPAQTAREGRFQLKVLEGYIDDIELEGDLGLVQSLVQGYLDRILEERPLRLATLERILLLVDDVPGLQISSVLRPSPGQVGAAQLLTRVERKAADGLAVIDNYGNEFSGIVQTALGGSLNAFTPWGERLTLVGLISDPIHGFDGNERVGLGILGWKIGTSGLFVEITGSYGVSAPGFTVEAFDFESTTVLVSALVGYPLIRSRDLNLTAQAGFDVVNTDTDFFDGETFSRDRLRVLHATIRSDFRDAWDGSSAVDVQFRQGLPILDASEKGDDFLSREDGTGVSTVVRGSVSRLQSVVEGIELAGAAASISLYGTVAAQYAFTDLLSDEEFDAGATRYGRGYDSAEISGDHGVGMTFELQFNHLLKFDYLDRYQAFGFYDLGRVWDRGPGENDYLSSTGVGLRASPVDFFSLELQVAKPISRPTQRSSDSKEAQFLIRTVVRL
jgi:hemolysin activation/secretion protein